MNRESLSSRRARLRVLAPVVLVSVFLLGGCRTMSTATATMVQSRFNGTTTTGARNVRFETINNDTIAAAGLEGPAPADGVEVFYNRGLGAAARSMAGSLSAALAAVKDQTGLDLRYKLRIYLLRVDSPPQSYDFAISDADRVCSFPLFVEAGREPDVSLLTGDLMRSYIMVHEIAEASLVRPGGGSPIVLGDGGAGPVRVVNSTRWFREGLASYAGYIAAEALRSGAPAVASAAPFQSPLSSLSRVGADIFEWNQMSPTKLDNDNYNAALGIFLLVEARYGRGAVRDVLRDISARGSVDGKALVAAFDRVTGGDFAKLVARFRFADTGVKAACLTPALALNSGIAGSDGLVVRSVRRDGPADDAGLRRGDVITSIGSLPVRDPFDYEVAVLRSMSGGTASVGILRDGRPGQLAVRLDDLKRAESVTGYVADVPMPGVSQSANGFACNVLFR